MDDETNDSDSKDDKGYVRGCLLPSMTLGAVSVASAWGIVWALVYAFEIGALPILIKDDGTDHYYYATIHYRNGRYEDALDRLKYIYRLDSNNTMAKELEEKIRVAISNSTTEESQQGSETGAADAAPLD